MSDNFSGSVGVELISSERKRQVELKGYDLEHDARCHPDGSLRVAAACYLLAGTDYMVVKRGVVPPEADAFPEWLEDDRVKHGVISSIRRGGAFAAAEIDRLSQKPL